jgi:thioredoxin-like negative regulator of GroEL
VRGDAARWISHLRKADAGKGLAKAQNLLKAGKHDDAYAAFDAVREDHRSTLRAVYGMALCKMRAGKPDEAAAIAADLLALLRTRVSVREERRDLDEALGLREQAKDGKKGKDGGKKKPVG